MPFEHQEFKEKQLWKAFTLNICLVVMIFILGIFFGLLINNKRLIESEIIVRAQSHFDNIVLTRRWNAMYGGVYVEKKPGVESNPYLKNPDILTENGRIYTKKNPALMTREISELADKKNSYQFHITSLKPINPNNKPDDFEKKALYAFERGEKELFNKVRQGDVKYFRYMAPLYVEEPCLECHGKQGYQIGDVRGGISVKFDITDIENTVQLNRYLLIVQFSLIIILLIGIIYFFIFKLNRKFSKMLATIKKLAITDYLTGIYNRRYFFNRLDEEVKRSVRYRHHLSCLLIDIDFFKDVNDGYGHKAGDIVLGNISKTICEHSRVLDIVARYGGEEFVLLLPETDIEGGINMAEKIRGIIEEHEINVGDSTNLHVTVSIGVSSFNADSLAALDDIDTIINDADKALYNAKKLGRNRVMSD